MRPPELPGGKQGIAVVHVEPLITASMRPPELPGGKRCRATRRCWLRLTCFNEAAGITRRKDTSVATEEAA